MLILLLRIYIIYFEFLSKYTNTASFCSLNSKIPINSNTEFNFNSLASSRS